MDFNNFPGKITRLVLSGGGTKGLAIMGALHYVHEHGGLDYVEEYWGTSIGSVISLLLLLGYTPFEAFHQFFMTDGFSEPGLLDLESILTETAFCPINIFGNKIRHFVEKKLGPGSDPTFLDLYKHYNKKLHIMGTNTDTMRGECFDVDTQPFMPVIDAIEISCDLPYIFTKKRYNGNTYVDGGFINNYAVNLADNNINYCLGVCVFGDMTENSNDYIGWLYRLLYIPIMELHRERISKLSDKFTNIELTINNISFIEMSPSNEKKVEVYSSGYKQARDILLNMNYDYVVKSRAAKSNDGWDVNFDWSDND